MNDGFTKPPRKLSPDERRRATLRRASTLSSNPYTCGGKKKNNMRPITLATLTFKELADDTKI